MKGFSRITSMPGKKVVAGALAVLAITLPASSVLAGTSANIQAATGVANVTAGDTTYSSSVNASYDQVVKVQVQYINTSNNPEIVANNVHIKINMPNAAGSTQTVTTNVAGSNTNSVSGQAVVNTGRSDASLQYEPGTTVAKVTNTDGSISQFNVPDSQSAVTSLNASGYLVNNGNPCQGASITVLARVMIPGVKIVKQVEKLGQSNAWAQTNTANPGDTLKYMITYQNTGNTIQNQVVVRDNLPPQMTLVPNTTVLTDASHPSGTLLPDNDIVLGGENIGDFGAGANAFLVFEVKVPEASQLQCGTTKFTNVGVVRPQGMNEFENSAVTSVTKVCSTPTTPAAPTTPATPTSLVNTGPGDVVGIFAATTIGGAMFHKLFLARRLVNRG